MQLHGKKNQQTKHIEKHAVGIYLPFYMVISELLPHSFFKEFINSCIGVEIFFVLLGILSQGEKKRISGTLIQVI